MSGGDGRGPDPTKGMGRAFLLLIISIFVTIWALLGLGGEVSKQGKALSRPKVLIGFAFWAILIWYMVS